MLEVHFQLLLQLANIHAELIHYINEMMTLIQFHRTYGFADWREDIKKMMIKAGADGNQTVFLFSDQQIKEESFVEDINMILNTADIPNLFPADEKGELIEKMQVIILRTLIHVEPAAFCCDYCSLLHGKRMFFVVIFKLMRICC